MAEPAGNDSGCAKRPDLQLHRNKRFRIFGSGGARRTSTPPWPVVSGAAGGALSAAGMVCGYGALSQCRPDHRSVITRYFLFVDRQVIVAWRAKGIEHACRQDRFNTVRNVAGEIEGIAGGKL